jgi:hypothetical protein
LFDDPPRDLDKDIVFTYLAGWALIQSGDVERGSRLVQSFVDLREPFDEIYGLIGASIASHLMLGSTERALNTLDSFAQSPDFGMFSRLILERSPVFDPIREEPAFVALLDDYRRNAEQQRQILQAKNEDAFTQ